MQTKEELEALMQQTAKVHETCSKLSEEELQEVFGGIKFRYFSVEKCPDCGYWEFMVCNRQLKICPQCGSIKIRRVFGI